ncbi:MAG: type IV pilus modification PilV family protein [Myxococcota bacterium]
MQARREGFSMLEVMIALSILAVGILGIGAVQLTATKLSGDSRVRTQAAFLAHQQIEVFRAMDIGTLTATVGTTNDPGNPIDPTPGDGQTVTFNRRWTITPDAGTGTTTVRVEVDYVDNLGNTRTVRLQTLRAGT